MHESSNNSMRNNALLVMKRRGAFRCEPNTREHARSYLINRLQAICSIA
jgi:hypothetical protein